MWIINILLKTLFPIRQFKFLLHSELTKIYLFWWFFFWKYVVCCRNQFLSSRWLFPFLAKQVIITFKSDFCESFISKLNLHFSSTNKTLMFRFIGNKTIQTSKKWQNYENWPKFENEEKAMFLLLLGCQSPTNSIDSVDTLPYLISKSIHRNICCDWFLIKML